jgi:hypothetical protein
MEQSGGYLGITLRDTLLRSAGFDLNVFRRVINEASLALFNEYWKLHKLGALPVAISKQVITDCLAGGVMGNQRVLMNLSKLDQPEIQSSDLQKIASELITLLAPKAKLLNLQRYRIRSVRAHLENIGDLTNNENLHNLNKEDLNELQQYVNEIERDKIVDQITLMKWIEKSHFLLTKISALFPLLNDESGKEGYTLSSRLKKGFISKKNLPTYKKYWESYCFEKLEKELNLKVNYEKSETFEFNIDELRKEISMSTSDRVKYINSRTSLDDEKKVMPFSDKYLLSREFIFNNSKLVINHSSSKINKKLIPLLISNIKTQYLLNPRLKTIKTSVSDGKDRIEILVEISEKTDIERIQEVLINL